MTNWKIGVLKGDGIGPEVISSARRVLEIAFEKYGVTYELVDLAVGLEAYRNTGRTLPPETIHSLNSCDGWIMGPLQTESYPRDDKDYPMSLGKIRKKFDLFANIRPIKSYLKNRNGTKIDLVIVRENTEDFLPNINLHEEHGEFVRDQDTVISLRVIRRSSCKRISRFAFEIARARQKKRLVTAVHKSNVLMEGDGFFSEEVRSCQRRKFPDISLEEKLADSTAMGLVMFPERFDVLLTTSLFGNILSDEASGLVGGPGISPSLNAGEKYAMAQAARGATPAIAGKGVANPVSEILSSVMLLDWLYSRVNDKQLYYAARSIENAVAQQLTSEDLMDRTMDVMGKATTEEFTERLVNRITARN